MANTAPTNVTSDDGITVATGTSGAGSSKAGVMWGIIGGVAAGVVAVLLLCTISLVCVKWLKINKERACENTEYGSPTKVSKKIETTTPLTIAHVAPYGVSHTYEVALSTNAADGVSHTDEVTLSTNAADGVSHTDEVITLSTNAAYGVSHAADKVTLSTNVAYGVRKDEEEYDYVAI